MLKSNKFFVLILMTFYCSSLLHAQNAKPAQPAPPEPDWASRMNKATTLYAEKDYKEVVELLKDFPESDTAYTTANFKLMSAYLLDEKYSEGIKEGWKGVAIKHNQYRRSLYDMIGAGYEEMANHDSSLIVYKMAVKEYPEFPRYYFGMALAYKGKKDYQKAIELFQYHIRLNPYHGLSHYYLGVICKENNYIIPSMLSFMTQLLVDDPGPRCLQSLANFEEMAKGGWSVDPDSIYWKMPAGTNNFEELDQIIRSKIALSEKFKSKVSLTYFSITKQMQALMEQLQFNAADTGFWMQYYVPFYMDLWKNNHFEGYTYNAFISVDDADVQKAVKKNMSAITKMAEFVRPALNKQRSDFWKKNKLTEKSPWFNANGVLSAIGDEDPSTEKPVGYWKYFYANGVLNNEGNYDTKGQEQGKWKYYYLTGELKSVKNTKDGDLADTTWTYHPNGQLDEINILKSGKLNGTSTGYYSTGAMQGSIQFVNDVKEGDSHFHYENGTKQYDAKFKADKMDGHYVEYYDNGNKKQEYDYASGAIKGPVKTWYRSGSIKSEGEYVNGVISGHWKYYHEKGGLEKEGDFSNGNESGIWKEYFENGKLKEESKYSNGVIEGDDVYYDDDGVLWSKLTYAKGKMMKYVYYDKKGTVLSSGERKGKQILLESYYPGGAKYRKGAFTDEGRDGKWITWTVNGIMSEEENYVSGQQEGLQRYYSDQGALHSEINYTQGVRDGFAVQYYDNGIINNHGWYKDGNQQGTFREYNPDGTLSEEYYFIEGEYNGNWDYFDPAGRLYLRSVYELGQIIGMIGYDSTGHEVFNEDISTGNKNFKTLHPFAGHKVESELNYKYGNFDGEIKEIYNNGKVKRVTSYKLGKRNGALTKYFFDGSLAEQKFYKDGERDSIWMEFAFGKKDNVFHYKSGSLEGEGAWYFPNGKLETVGDYKDDERQGYFYYYAYDGMLRFRLKYDKGVVQSYSYLGPDSTFVPEIMLKDASGPVKSFFRNGKPSADFTYFANAYDGSYKLYYADGKIAKECTFVKHQKEGVSKEYYPGGKVWKEETYLYDDLNGPCKYYSDKGTLAMELNYKYGLMHGPAKIYDATGKVTKKLVFYNDEPIE